MSGIKKFDHSGSSFDSFLQQEGILAETEAVALKRVIAWQIEQAMAAKRITKNAMAKRLSTSRTQIDRLLDPSHVGVSIETITRAAKAVGKRVTFQIVDEEVSRQARQAQNGLPASRRKSAKPAKTTRKDIAQAG
jgi:antitoxin HicB